MTAGARFTVRRARIADAPLLKELEARVREDEADGEGDWVAAAPEDPKRAIAKLRSELRRRASKPSDTAVFLGWWGQDPAGFVRAGPQSFKRHEARYAAELMDVRVFQPFRGRGGGRRLVQEAVRAMIERGFFSLSAWTNASDVGARGFAERMGGVLADRRWLRVEGRRFAQVAYGWSDLSVLFED